MLWKRMHTRVKFKDSLIISDITSLQWKHWNLFGHSELIYVCSFEEWVHKWTKSSVDMKKEAWRKYSVFPVSVVLPVFRLARSSEGCLLYF